MSGYIAKTAADDILTKGSTGATRLMNYLWKNNRGEDAVKAEEDHDYYLKLLQEYNETHPAPVLAEDADAVLPDITD